MALYQLHFLQNACFQVRIAPGQRPLCPIDTFLISFENVVKCEDINYFYLYSGDIIVLLLKSVLLDSQKNLDTFLPYIPKLFRHSSLSKQCRPRSDQNAVSDQGVYYLHSFDCF